MNLVVGQAFVEVLFLLYVQCVSFSQNGEGQMSACLHFYPG